MAQSEDAIVTNYWDLIRHGNLEKALAVMQENYARDQSATYIMELGVGYLWAQQFEAAWEHFKRAMQIHPFTTDVFFGMAGAAKWCIDDTDAAFRTWKAGVNVQFADAAGGVDCPLLMWVASVLRPGSFSKDEVALILKKRVQDQRIKNWPGALAQFVLGIIDEETLAKRSIQGRNRVIPASERWRIGFYKYVCELERESLSREMFNELMREMADTSAPEWSTEGEFLSLLWNEEFFIARHEATSAAE